MARNETELVPLDYKKMNDKHRARLSKTVCENIKVTYEEWTMTPTSTPLWDLDKTIVEAKCELVEMMIPY